MSSHSHYIGRFAPSPSGALHFGSLIAALGSYLRAKQQQGTWLVRIEDVDPPREIAGASDAILRTLEAHGLHWDGKLLYQSDRLSAYQACIDHLIANQQAYYCQCSRKQIQARGGLYDGHCRHANLQHGAVRIINHVGINKFTDLRVGEVQVSDDFAHEDFIIKRSDGLYAYQLAVVLDDIEQGMTEIVRGYDLLEATCRQLSLYQILGKTAPQFLHLPLACADKGFKLSKQNHALAIDNNHAKQNISKALQFLGQASVDESLTIEQMLQQAVSQFKLTAIPSRSEILI